MNTAMIHVLSVLAFMIVSFAAQALSHFVINQDHYASMARLRSEPIIPMGLAAMVLQGALTSIALRSWRPSTRSVLDGLRVSITFGVFLAAYFSLAEPARYLVPDICAWVRIEATTSTIQFVAFGASLGFIHSRLSTSSAAPA